jgi:hypothetical protein
MTCVLGRFCEAMASGALVLVDHMFVPRAQPFVHGKHVIYYDNSNKTAFFEVLDTFVWPSSTASTHLSDQKRREEIAHTGYIHAMQHHRAANLMDFVFRTLHVKELATAEGRESDLLTNLEYAQSVGGYSQHGYVLRLQVLRRQENMQKPVTTKHNKDTTAVQHNSIAFQ